MMHAKILRNEAGHKGRIKKLKFTNIDRNQDYLEKEIIMRENYVNDFLSRFHEAILNDINKQNDSQTSTIIMDCDISIPVCLAGVGNFFIEGLNINIIINVIPYQENTYVIISSFKEYENYINDYLQYHSRHPLAFINMIESWMIYGTDHWFLKPSVWDKIKLPYRQQILDDFINSTYNILKEYKHTILNGTKESIINGMIDCIEEIEPAAIDLMNNEISKLTSKIDITHP